MSIENLAETPPHMGKKKAATAAKATAIKVPPKTGPSLKTGPKPGPGGNGARLGGSTAHTGKMQLPVHHVDADECTTTLQDSASGDSYDNGLCIQCDLLVLMIEESIKQFPQLSQQSTPNIEPNAPSGTGNTLHLVLKELRNCALEVGQCCGGPYGPGGGDESSRSSSSTTDSAAAAIFWENLQRHVHNRGIVPPKAPPGATKVAKGPGRQVIKASSKKKPAGATKFQPPKPLNSPITKNQSMPKSQEKEHYNDVAINEQ